MSGYCFFFRLTIFLSQDMHIFDVSNAECSFLVLFPDLLSAGPLQHVNTKQFSFNGK